MAQLSAKMVVDVKLGPEAKLIIELLDVLPDSPRPYDGDDERDESWMWAWEELSSEAQEKVKQVRNKANLFLEENIKAKGV